MFTRANWLLYRRIGPLTIFFSLQSLRSLETTTSPSFTLPMKPPQTPTAKINLRLGKQFRAFLFHCRSHGYHYYPLLFEQLPQVFSLCPTCQHNNSFHQGTRCLLLTTEYFEISHFWFILTIAAYNSF